MIVAVDDSEIAIGGRPHTILAGVIFEGPSETRAKIRAIKRRFGLRDDEEIKWNATRIENQEDREAMSSELLRVLSRVKYIATIMEGTNRQEALERLSIQLDDFLQNRSTFAPEPEELQLVIDEGIIQDPPAFKRFLSESGRPRLVESLKFASVSSHAEELIQCADICAGFTRLLVDLALGRPNRRLVLLEKFDDGSSHPVDLDLRHLVLFSLRYSMWGEVPPPPDPDNIRFDGTYPFLHAAGRGLRIHSTIDEKVITQIYHHAGIVYFGCLH